MDVKRKILVIDDEEDILELTQRFLQSRGFQVMALGDGNNAYTVVKEFLPDLIFTDMLLPGKDGQQICKEIKSDKNLKNIPIIMTTGKMLEDTVSENVCDALGPDDYITKPFDIDDLLDKIKKYVK